MAAADFVAAELFIRDPNAAELDAAIDCPPDLKLSNVIEVARFQADIHGCLYFDRWSNHKLRLESDLQSLRGCDLMTGYANYVLEDRHFSISDERRNRNAFEAVLRHLPQVRAQGVNVITISSALYELFTISYRRLQDQQRYTWLISKSKDVLYVSGYLETAFEAQDRNTPDKVEEWRQIIYRQLAFKNALLENPEQDIAERNTHYIIAQASFGPKYKLCYSAPIHAINDRDQFVEAHLIKAKSNMYYWNLNTHWAHTLIKGAPIIIHGWRVDNVITRVSTWDVQKLPELVKAKGLAARKPYWKAQNCYAFVAKVLDWLSDKLPDDRSREFAMRAEGKLANGWPQKLVLKEVPKLLPSWFED